MVDAMPKDLSSLSLLGQSGAKSQRKLETFPAPDGLDLVTFQTSEFTSMCPITGQPDFADISISYIPKERCVESKSLKLYLQTFRTEGSFCEALAVQIRNDLVLAIRPQSLEVVVSQTPRGGLALTARSEYWEKPDGFDS